MNLFSSSPGRIGLHSRLAILAVACGLWSGPWGSDATAQSVCLPAPRLLTTMPMGGTAGSHVEVTITGENLEDADQLIFSDPRLTATPKLDEGGKPVPNRFVITIPADCPTGLYEARMMTRLGISSSRVFNVGSLPEVMQTKANTSRWSCR